MIFIPNEVGLHKSPVMTPRPSIKLLTNSNGKFRLNNQNKTLQSDTKTKILERQRLSTTRLIKEKAIQTDVCSFNRMPQKSFYGPYLQDLNSKEDLHNEELKKSLSDFSIRMSNYNQQTAEINKNLSKLTYAQSKLIEQLMNEKTSLVKQNLKLKKIIELSTTRYETPIIDTHKLDEPSHYSYSRLESKSLSGIFHEDLEKIQRLVQ